MGTQIFQHCLLYTVSYCSTLIYLFIWHVGIIENVLCWDTGRLCSARRWLPLWEVLFYQVSAFDSRGKTQYLYFCPVHHIHEDTKNSKLPPFQQTAWLWYSSRLPGSVLKFQTCQPCFVFLILFVQHGSVPFPLHPHPLSKKTILTATVTFHCTKYCKLS